NPEIAKVGGAGVLPWLVAALAVTQVGSALAAANTSFVLKSLMMPAAFYFAFALATQTVQGRQSIDKMLWLLLLATIPLSAYAVAQSQGYEILPYSRTL